jgi:hypothetical protein
VGCLDVLAAGGQGGQTKQPRKGLFLFRGCLNRNPIFYNGSECPPARLLSCGIAPRQWAALALLLIF